MCGIYASERKIVLSFGNLNRQNWLRFVCKHFKSGDQSLEKTSFDFPNIFRAMQSCAMNVKSRIINKETLQEFGQMI